MEGKLWNRVATWSPLLVVGALLAAPMAEDGPTICPFALTTGMACPGCGMTRAASSLVRGDLTTALAFHPLVPAVALLATTGWVWYLLRRSGRVQPLSNRVVNGALIATGLALVGVWVARLLLGSLPPV